MATSPHPSGRADIAEAQKSEVHHATLDAESSPVSEDNGVLPLIAREPAKLEKGHGPRRNEPLTDHETIIIDETDDGGPLVISSDDPALNPPRLPREPFPTDRTPEVDPPVD